MTWLAPPRPAAPLTLGCRLAAAGARPRRRPATPGRHPGAVGETRGVAHELTVPGVVERAADRFSSAEAMVDGDERWSFGELAARVDEAARALIASGVEPGDRIALWAPNMAEWAVAALATYRCGAVVVPLNTRFKGPEAAYVLEASRARLLFTVTDFLATDYVALPDAADRPATLEAIVVLRGPGGAGATTWADLLGRAVDIDATTTAKRADAIDPDDVCDILFTSGTTG